MKMNHLPKAGALLALSLTLSLGAQASQPEDPAAHPDRVAEVKPVVAEKEVPWKAKGMAPLHAMAHFVARDADDSRKYMWKLNVYVPKVTWETAGDGPPIKDPRLAGRESWHVKTEVKMVEMNLPMGYSPSTQLAEGSQNRIVDLKGKRLSMAEAKKRLDDDTPVLLAVNGKMPEVFYTQCMKEDTLVVLIGNATPKEFNLLPSVKVAVK